MDLELLRELATPNETKVMLCVVDGLGGLPHPETGRSELQTASIPNLDRLAEESICGLSLPVAPGVTPGSGPGHLALFGYDPLKFEVGRGVLESLGIDFDLQPIDVAARGNFCTLDANGLISDRRAGRMPTEETIRVCEKLKQIKLPGVEVIIEPVREHRWVLVLRGEGLDDHLTQTDPEREGVAPHPVRAHQRVRGSTAHGGPREPIRHHGARRAQGRDAGERAAAARLRQAPDLPPMPQVTQMRAGAFAVYPMYRGLAKLVGMTVAPGGGTPDVQLEAVKARWDEFDFFFYHYKKADTAGEDGDFRAKVGALEEFDELVPKIRDLNPDVLIVAGDHSTPSLMAAHSWHPVPFMIWSQGWRRRCCG